MAWYFRSYKRQECDLGSGSLDRSFSFILFYFTRIYWRIRPPFFLVNFYLCFLPADMIVRDSSTQRDRVHHSGCSEGDRGREGVGAPGPSKKRKGPDMATGTPSKCRREVERVTAMPPPAPQAGGATVGAPVAGSSRTPVAQPDSLLSAFDKHVGPLLPGSAFEDVSSPSLQASLNPLLRDFILVRIVSTFLCFLLWCFLPFLS